MRPEAAPFPGAVTLVSRACWFARDHPGPVLALGLIASAPAAGLVLLLFREAQLSIHVAGQTTRGLWPLVAGVAACSFARFPLRLALARFMAQQAREEPAGPATVLGFALAQAPTALAYGCVAELGMTFGALFLLPTAWALRANLAFHFFARGSGSARAAYQEAARVPMGLLGARLQATCVVVWAASFAVLWSSPSAALALAEWLMRADVAAARAFTGSFAFALAAALVAALVVEVLWSVTWGLVARAWDAMHEGADLERLLADVERRAVAEAAFR